MVWGVDQSRWRLERTAEADREEVQAFCPGASFAEMRKEPTSIGEEIDRLGCKGQAKTRSKFIFTYISFTPFFQS